jgi:hypothetical protein
MALKSTSKAEAMTRDLAEKLALRIAGSASGRVDTLRQIKDANGWPVMILSDGGTETAGNPVIAIRIKGADAVSKDIFGNDIIAAAPHIAELAYELDATEAEPSRKDIAKVLFELVKLGTKLQIKEIADGTAVSVAAMDAASAAEEYDWLYWPTKGV